MPPNHFKITAKVWLYQGPSAWHFVSIPKATSQKISTTFDALKRGWGSLKVRITLGHSTWDTSIFPDKKTGEYFLPLKSQIRKKENISANDTIHFLLEILI